MKTLQISPDIALPLDTATQTIAILARKRVGKTYTASVMAEELIKAEIPLVVLDPTGAWWGLRASADGKREGFPVVIIGGAHADVPLEETAGKLIADLVVDHPGYYIIDFSQIEHDAAMRRFANDFGKRFYFRKEQKRFAIQLIIDEADIFAPQNPGKDEIQILHTYDNIVRRGGIRGIGVTMISQRPAVLNKNILTQCETLLVLQISGSQDVDAIEHWIRLHGSKEERAQFLGSVATLQRGEAWLWSPSWLQVFKKIHIRERETFNSSATPKAGEKLIVPAKLAPVDIAKLGEQIKATAERAKENDPAELRKEVLRLKGALQVGIKEIDKLKATPAKSESTISTREVSKLKHQLQIAMQFITKIHAYGFQNVKPAEVKAAVEAAMEKATGIIETKLTQRHGELTKLQREAEKIIGQLIAITNDVQVDVTVRHNEPFSVAAPRMARREPIQRIDRGSNGSNDSLPTGERKILTACAQFEGVAKEDLTVLTGFKRSTRDAYIQRLREKAFVEDANGTVFATEPGLTALGEYEPLPVGDELREYWLARLPEGERRILEVLVAHYPNFLDRESLEESTGFKRSTRDAYLQRMKPKRIVEFGNGTVRAAEKLFS